MHDRFKITITLGLSVFLMVSVFAEEGAAADSEQSGGYVAIELQISSVNGGLGYVFGLSGGYQTKDGTIIGAAIYDLLNGTPFPDQSVGGDEPLRRTKMHWGGLVIGQEFGVNDDWRPSVSALVGFGDVSAYTSKKKDSSDQSFYWVVQPVVWLGYQATDHFRPQLGGGWRIHMGVDTPGTNSRQLGGPLAAFNSAFTSL
jgi:hypothetical protein